MKKKGIRDIGIFLLAVVFSTALMFAFIEIPKLIDQFLQSVVNTPQTDPAQDAYKIELFYEAYFIRLIGYLCLGTVSLLIILGFATKRTGLAWLGGVAMFLPVFATFAHSMFYLAGLGLFNVIFFPLMDISVSLMDLGRIVLVPYWFFMWLFGLFHWNAHTALVYFFMITGSLLFVLSVFTWLRTRNSGNKVASHWLYRFSRHPQYLGWIIWSYGLMLYGPGLNEMKKSWGWNGSLAWLLSTMVIIGICMLEELKMKQIAGQEYETYRDHTPFLFPLPGSIKRALEVPMKILFRKPRPERRREVAVIIASTTLLLMGISFIWVDLPGKHPPEPVAQSAYDRDRVDSLLYEIRKPQNRRDRSMAPYHELVAMGSQAYPVLIDLIGNEQPEVREFALDVASEHHIEETVPAIISAIHDTIDRNKRSAIRALGQLHVTEATDTLLYFLENNVEGYRKDVLLYSLALLECKKIIPYLEEELKGAPWYSWSQTIRNMMKLDYDLALGHVYAGLEDTDPLIRREAVYLILDELPPEALSRLKRVADDPNWEVRFYARQAIKLIRDRDS